MTTIDDEVDAGACTPGDPDCSLREAIVAANADTVADVIRLPAGTYMFNIAPSSPNDATTGDLDIANDVTIERSGSGTVIIDARNLDRAFDIADAGTDVSLADVTVTNGQPVPDVPSHGISGAGGAIRTAGQLTFSRVVTEENHAPGKSGGGVAVLSNGNLQATGSSFVSNDAADGGAIAVFAQDATATLDRSIVRGNSAAPTFSTGGGILAFGGLTLRETEVSANTATGGGGVYANGGPSGSLLALRNVTISGNRATGNGYPGGGGLRLGGKVTPTIEDSTIAANLSDEGAANFVHESVGPDDDLTDTFRRTLIADGRRLPTGAAPNCSISPGSGLVTVVSDRSLEDADTCGLDKPNSAPALAALSDNGGGTRTHALAVGSAAIDAGGTGCPATDQRGPSFPRPLGAACDIGAFEAPESGATDADGDGFPDATDNCPALAQADQRDSDGDAAGDACDPDDDNDGVEDASDNCALDANADQRDSDSDAVGDPCDPDDDNDGVVDASDNCRFVPNADQVDGDHDGAGDACEQTITGTVTLDARPAPGVDVLLCTDAGCRHAPTDNAGHYVFLGPPLGPATMAASTGGDAPIDEKSVTSTAAGLVQDFALHSVKPPPPGTTISPPSGSNGSVPLEDWRGTFYIETRGCPAARMTYKLVARGRVVRQGTLESSKEDPTLFRATIPPLAPLHGYVQVLIERLGCGRNGHTGGDDDGHGEVPKLDQFDVYIDPSGKVRDLKGRPVFGATVRLLRSDQPDSGFTLVANGSSVMSPVNRRNPDRTDASGRFGWDVIPGFYRVQASKAGCKAQQSPTGVAETDVLEIPPPVLDLDIRLNCPYRPKLVLGPLPRGTLRLTRRGAVRYRVLNVSPFPIRGKVALRRGRGRLAARRFRAGANRATTVTVPLSRAARRLVAKRRRLRVTAAVRATGAKASERTATASVRRAITLRPRG